MPDENNIHFARLLAYQCRLVGMMAENKIRSMRGESPAYDEIAFFDLANEIEMEWRSW